MSAAINCTPDLTMTSKHRPMIEPVRRALVVSLTFYMLLVGSTSADLVGSLNSVRARASRILFGDLWPCDQYCGDSRSAEVLLRDDVEIEKLINGSALSHIVSKKDSDHKWLKNQLEQLNVLAIKSQLSLSAMCSVAEWGHAEEHTFGLSNGPQDNPKECRRLIEQLGESLDHIVSTNRSRVDARSLQLLLSFLGSSGSIPSGPIYQNHIWTGNYQACVGNPLMRYCFGAYKSRNWPKPTMRGEFFRVGLCLPSSCNSQLARSKDHLRMLDKTLNYHSGFRLAEDQPYELVDIHCLPTEDSPIRRQLDWLTIALISVLAIWLSLVAYATFSQDASLESFNMSLNWAKFRKTSSRVLELDVLNGLKVIIMFWVISTHLFLFLRDYLLDPFNLRDDLQRSLVGMFLAQGQHAIPMYFIISGFLCGRNYLNRRVSATKLVLHRYFKMLPMYLLAYCYIRKFTHLAGSGPFWDYGVSLESSIRQCHKESWLIPLLMLANFIPSTTHCVPTGWHIANDFQLYLTLPLILGAYGRSRRTGRLVSVASFLLSHLHHVWIYHSSNLFNFRQLAHEPISFGSRIILGRMHYDYVNPFGRIGSYHLGVLLADLLAARREKEENSSEKLVDIGGGKSISRPASSLTIISTLVAGLSCIAAALLAYFTPPELKDLLVLGTYSKALVYPLLRLLVELGWFLVLYALLQSSRLIEAETNNDSVQRSYNSPELDTKRLKRDEKPRRPKQTIGCWSILSLRIWNVLVKLLFTLILFHFEFIRYFVRIETRMIQFSWSKFCRLLALVIPLSFLFCGFVHIAIEMPLTSLINRLLFKGFYNKRPGNTLPTEDVSQAKEVKVKQC